MSVTPDGIDIKFTTTADLKAAKDTADSIDAVGIAAKTAEGHHKSLGDAIATKVTPAHLALHAVTGLLRHALHGLVLGPIIFGFEKLAEALFKAKEKVEDLDSELAKMSPKLGPLGGDADTAAGAMKRLADAEGEAAEKAKGLNDQLSRENKLLDEQKSDAERRINAQKQLDLAIVERDIHDPVSQAEAKLTIEKKADDDLQKVEQDTLKKKRALNEAAQVDERSLLVDTVRKLPDRDDAQAKLKAAQRAAAELKEAEAQAARVEEGGSDAQGSTPEEREGFQAALEDRLNSARARAKETLGAVPGRSLDPAKVTEFIDKATENNEQTQQRIIERLSRLEEEGIRLRQQSESSARQFGVGRETIGVKGDTEINKQVLQQERQQQQQFDRDQNRIQRDVNTGKPQGGLAPNGAMDDLQQSANGVQHALLEVMSRVSTQLKDFGTQLRNYDV